MMSLSPFQGRRYRVTTWDSALQQFTPQSGVRAAPLTWSALRRALRILQTLGYGCQRDDPSVLVERIDLPESTP